MNWNELGQPIGRESMTLSYFVGSYARRNVPIICDDWRKNEWRNMKEALWDEIKVQYIQFGCILDFILLYYFILIADTVRFRFSTLNNS